MSQPRLDFSVFQASIQGARPYQEDAADVWRPNGPERGSNRPLLAVLSDGMGGHVSGEVASRLACERYKRNFASGQDSAVGMRLDHSLIASNDALGEAIRQNGALNGMGCTLIAGYIDGDGLRWVSVGDSMLLRYRGGQLERLNQDHSLGALLDKQAEARLITADEARNHPRRRTLRSALTGGVIALKEVMTEAWGVQHGDWIILASDGLETLSGDEIAHIINEHQAETPEVVGRALLQAVEARQAPHQDNTTVIVIRAVDQALLETEVVQKKYPKLSPAAPGAAQADVSGTSAAPLDQGDTRPVTPDEVARLPDLDVTRPLPRRSNLFVFALIAAALGVFAAAFVLGHLNPPGTAPGGSATQSAGGAAVGGSGGTADSAAARGDAGGASASGRGSATTDAKPDEAKTKKDGGKGGSEDKAQEGK